MKLTKSDIAYPSFNDTKFFILAQHARCCFIIRHPNCSMFPCCLFSTFTKQILYALKGNRKIKINDRKLDVMLFSSIKVIFDSNWDQYYLINMCHPFLFLCSCSCINCKRFPLCADQPPIFELTFIFKTL